MPPRRKNKICKICFSILLLCLDSQGRGILSTTVKAESSTVNIQDGSPSIFPLILIVAVGANPVRLSPMTNLGELNIPPPPSHGSLGFMAGVCVCVRVWWHLGNPFPFTLSI